jgi:hypothetical protein
MDVSVARRRVPPQYFCTLGSISSLQARMPQKSEVVGWQHLLMKYPNYQHAAGAGKVEHNVPADLKSSQAGADRVTGSADGGIAGQEIEAVFQFRNVPIRLLPTPLRGRVGDNPIDVVLSFN